MPDCPYGSSYDPATSPVAASTRGPAPVTPVDVPRGKSARAKLTAGALAGCGTRVGVGEGVLVLRASLGAGVFVSPTGGADVLTHAAASSVAATAVANRRAPCPLLNVAHRD